MSLGVGPELGGGAWVFLGWSQNLAKSVLFSNLVFFSPVSLFLSSLSQGLLRLYVFYKYPRP